MVLCTIVKRVIQIKLLPTPEQADALEETMRHFNAACNWVAERAFERQLANRYALHKRYYYLTLRRLGVSVLLRKPLG